MNNYRIITKLCIKYAYQLLTRTETPSKAGLNGGQPDRMLREAAVIGRPRRVHAGRREKSIGHL